MNLYNICKLYFIKCANNEINNDLEKAKDPATSSEELSQIYNRTNDDDVINAVIVNPNISDELLQYALVYFPEKAIHNPLYTLKKFTDPNYLKEAILSKYTYGEKFKKFIETTDDENYINALSSICNDAARFFICSAFIKNKNCTYSTKKQILKNLDISNRDSQDLFLNIIKNHNISDDVVKEKINELNFTGSSDIAFAINNFNILKNYIDLSLLKDGLFQLYSSNLSAAIDLINNNKDIFKPLFKETLNNIIRKPSDVKKEFLNRKNFLAKSVINTFGLNFYNEIIKENYKL